MLCSLFALSLAGTGGGEGGEGGKAEMELGRTALLQLLQRRSPVVFTVFTVVPSGNYRMFLSLYGNNIPQLHYAYDQS